MKKKCIIIASMLLANSTYCMDVVEYLKIRTGSVSVTPTNLVIKLVPTRDHWAAVVNANGERSWGEFVEQDEAVIINAGQWTIFGRRNGLLILTPVIFKDQRQGFRITDLPTGDAAYANDLSTPTTITYFALGDIADEMGEEDVEMTMDMTTGEWERIEDSTNLIVEKLGWAVYPFVWGKEITPHDLETFHIPDTPKTAELWNLLMEKVVAKQNAKAQFIPTKATKSSPENAPTTAPIALDDPASPQPPNNVIARGVSAPKQPSVRKWLYAIPALLLCTAVGLVIHWLIFQKK